MTHLVHKKCIPCSVGGKPLAAQICQSYLNEIPNWIITPDGKSIERRVQFKNYYQTMAFVNAVAWMAHQEDHHPDLEVHYDHCLIRYNTHSVGGLSENDFICAAKVNAILAE
ncbi:MAG: pterin-4-alpha-carbinolamine dehydratase [Gammaproteobacteria bacterium]|jgi:4a-hydroxytetrahydrobiopterin dehydratase|nr:pterin-4-alpha-carbinolamine dehydratase [Gammaproteobacteria bacterium]